MNKRFRRIITLVYIFSFVVLLIGSTYAYFTLVEVSSVSPEINISSEMTDYLVFDAGNPIRITPTTENFNEGMGNLSQSTFASAYVRLAEGSGRISYNYNIFLNIDKNTLEYSTVSKTPELILSITDPNGKEVTNVEGLNYVTINGVSGFDITKAIGKYYIAFNYLIETNTEILHKWNTKVTFLNLEESQDGNLGKELLGVIQIEKAE